MKSKWRLTIFISITFLVFAFSSSWAGMTTVAQESDEGNSLIVGHLEMKETIVTIHAGEGENYYTVRARNGAILADRITERQLKYSFNEIHNRIEGGIAGLLALW